MKIKKFVYLNLINFFRKLNKFYDTLFYKHWNSSPFCVKPKGEVKDYLQLFSKAKEKKYPQVEEYEIKNGFAINKLWLDELALKTQITIKKSELCYAHGNVLYTTLCNYINKHYYINLFK